MVFTAELKKARAADSPASTTVDLPIGPYRMLDILDKLRLHEQETIIWEITDYHLFEELEPLLDKTGAFFELNALAWRLMELDEAQSTAFAGLLAMEDAKGPIPLPRLIDLAYSTQSCHVLGDAPSGSQPDRTRASEKGVFVKQSRDHPGGYVSRHGDLTEAYKNLDLTPRKPEYVIRASIKYDPVAGPDVDLSQVICIDLPASEEQVRYMDVQMTGDWLGTYLYSIDSVIPQITDHILCVDSIQETDLFRLNALAKRLAELDGRDMAVFEGLVCMDLQKGEKAIPVGSLIDYAHSGDCCHVVEDVVTDEELGRFLVENGFIPEAEDLSDEALKLLDYTRIGKEHREAEGSAFTGFGYVERHSELPRVCETMDFRSCKPPYTVLLNIGLFPNVNTPKSRPEPIQVQLPASDEELQDILARLGKQDWNGVMSAILDCPVPSMNKRLFLEDDIPRVVEWAKALRALDETDSLPKYKALLNAADCEDLSKAVSLIDALGQYTFCPEYGSASEVAKGQLHLILGEREAGMILPHLDLNGYGKDLIQYLGGAVTPYGFLEKRENAPTISEENQPQRGGMEMM